MKINASKHRPLSFVLCLMLLLSFWGCEGEFTHESLLVNDSDYELTVILDQQYCCTVADTMVVPAHSKATISQIVDPVARVTSPQACSPNFFIDSLIVEGGRTVVDPGILEVRWELSEWRKGEYQECALVLINADFQ